MCRSRTKKLRKPTFEPITGETRLAFFVSKRFTTAGPADVNITTITVAKDERLIRFSKPLKTARLRVGKRKTARAIWSKRAPTRMYTTNALMLKSTTIVEKEASDMRNVSGIGTRYTFPDLSETAFAGSSSYLAQGPRANPWNFGAFAFTDIKRSFPQAHRGCCSSPESCTVCPQAKRTAIIRAPAPIHQSSYGPA